jgi:O-antigen/teichoic acid export membrane protein
MSDYITSNNDSNQLGEIGDKSQTNQAGYRSVFKATSVFGGVQVFNILISLIRGKILAILIGTAGMGLNGLLLSSLTLLRGVSGLGLNESAVKDISSANQSADTGKIKKVYGIFRRWIWFTALLGVALTIGFSPVLSNIAFGDNSHTTSFLLLSSTFIFTALTGGIYTLLRGLRKIKILAQANIVGSVTGLLVALPIFYFYGIKGVVPAIIITSAATYLVSIYYRNKIKIRPASVSMKETIAGGKQMAGLGITLTASSLMGDGITFILNSYISKVGSLGDLGVYNAGRSIMIGYVGMVFTAMATDYYPRLSAVINNPIEWKKVVNQQAEIVILVLGPILCFILFSAPYLIKILLSEEFLPAIDFLVWASLALIFMGISWVSGYVMISMGDKKVFFIAELAAKSWSLIINIVFYHFYGITGLGISMLINFFLSAVLMYFILKIRYGYILSKSLYKYSAVFIILLSSTIGFILVFDYPYAYIFSLFTLIISSIISLRGLNYRLDILNLVKKVLKK